MRTENDPGRWKTGYDFPAVRDGRVVKETLHDGPAEAELRTSCSTRGGRSLPTFACARRIALLFDFEWINHNFFFDLYRRSASYFEGSELSARGRPADARERALLAPFPDAVRADVLDGTWPPPVTRRLRPRPRRRCKRALDAVCAAGYELRGTELRRRARPATVHVRDHGHHPRRGAARACCSPASLKRAGITCGCASSMPCNTTRGASLRFRHDPDTAGTSRFLRATSRPSIGARPRPTSNGTPQLHGRQEPGDRRHDRGPAQGTRARANSSRRCARSIAC